MEWAQRYIYAQNDGKPAHSYPFGQSPYSSGWTLIRTLGKQGPELGGKTLQARSILDVPTAAGLSAGSSAQLVAWQLTLQESQSSESQD